MVQNSSSIGPTPFSFGAGIAMVCLGIGSCYYLGSAGDAKTSPKYSIQEADLNANGKPDKFYTIDGKVAIIEVDGEPILEFLKKLEEK